MLADDNDSVSVRCWSGGEAEGHSVGACPVNITHDCLFGGEGDDVIYGHNGYDTITGGVGNDILKGQSGYDVIYGNSGMDVIDGGNETDRCYDSINDLIVNCE